MRGSRHLQVQRRLCVTLGPFFNLSESKLSREDPR